MKIKHFLLPFLLFAHLLVVAQQDKITLVSWNISGFGSKDHDQLENIANRLKIADIVAIQEVSIEDGPDNLKVLLRFLNQKQESWSGSFSEGTNSSSGHKERFAYLWKKTRIKAKHKGELVQELQYRIQREPYLMKFEFSGNTVELVNVHITSESRELIDQELEELNKYLINRPSSSMIVIGDFNANEDNKALKKIISERFSIALIEENTTLKKKCKEWEYLSKATDNILYSEEIEILNSGAIDYVGSCAGLKRAKKLSDHIPVFIQFSIK